MACARTSQISACLNQIYGENVNKKFELKGSQVLIGRADKADIKLKCLNVSRRHCLLIYTDKGWEVKDNNSQNGTWVSGQKLKPGESRLIDCGDIIFLGPPTEMPQAFCYEINYSTGIQSEFSNENEGVQDVLNESKDSLGDVKNFCVEISSPKKETQLNKSDAEIIVISPEKELPSTSAAFGMNNEDLFSTPADNTYKRKLAPTSLFEVSSSLHSDPKKTKCMQSNTVNSQKLVSDKCNSPVDQIYEVSSTGSDQVENSESLLDMMNEDVPDQSCQKDINAINEHQNEGESENELLKTKLNLMTEEIDKLKKQRAIYEERYKSVWERKNKILKKQLAEQQKLKDDLQNCEQKVKDEIKKEIMEKLEEDLICHICTELLIKPTVLQCSHTFCEYCIHEWKKKKNECPMCRCKFQTMTRVLTLEHFIDKTLETLTPEQRVKREEIIKERLMAEEQKKIKKASGSPKYARRRTRSRRMLQSRDQARRNIEMSRNLLLPLQLPPVSYPLFINNPNFRFPDVLISDSERETVNIFVSP